MDGANKVPDMNRAQSFSMHRDSTNGADPKYQTATPSLLTRWRRVTSKKRSRESLISTNEADSSSPIDDLICLDSFQELSGEHEPRLVVTRESVKGALQEVAKGNGSHLDIFSEVRNLTTSNIDSTLRNWTSLEKNVGFLTAAYLDRRELMEAFLANAADVTYYEPKFGFTALHVASYSGSVTVVDFLIKKGLPVNHIQVTYTPLHCAALGAAPDAARQLLAAGALVNKSGLAGETVLHCAIRARSSACVRVFVESGVDVSVSDSCGVAPLHLAADLDDVDCVRALVDSDQCEVDQPTKSDQNTALHIAAQGGCIDIVTLLLDRGAHANAKNSRSKTPLHFSSKVCVECTELLLKRGADSNASDVECRTPLHTAVSRSEVRFGPDITTLLLTWNASVNAQDRYGYTPLHIAALNELTECVEILLGHGADVSARTRGGTAALGLIARKTPSALSSVRQQLDACISCSDPEVSYREVKLSFNFRYLLRGGERGDMSFLQTFVDEGQRELLEHPLCEAFLHLKWEKIRKYYAARLAFCLVFVSLLTIYVLTALSYQCYKPVDPDEIEVRGLRIEFDISLCANKSIAGQWLREHPEVVEAEWYLLLFVTILEIMRKLYGLNGYKSFRAYWTLANIVEWLVIIAVFATSFIFTGQTHIWQNHVGAFAILFGWANLMIMIGHLPIFGSYVAMYTKVQKEFAKLLAAYICLLIGFTACFCAIFVQAQYFDNPFVGFIKTLAMMVGEFEFGELLKEIREMDNIPATIALCTFVLFLLFVTVILINLLIGIAVHDIQGLQKTAGLSKLVGLTTLISHIETALFAKRLPAFFTHLLSSSARIRRVVVSVKPLNPQEMLLPRDIMRTALEIARQDRCKKLEQKRVSRLTSKKLKDNLLSGSNQDMVELLLCLSEEMKELKRLILIQK